MSQWVTNLGIELLLQLKSTEVQYPRPVDIPTIPEISKNFWKVIRLFYVCPHILNIPVIPQIPTIPEISIIIQIRSRSWFQKCMTLYVCSNIPEIFNIPKIPTIPEIPIIIQITLSLWFRKCMTLDAYLSLLTFSTFPTFLTFRNSHYFWSYCLDLLPCKIWRS